MIGQIKEITKLVGHIAVGGGSIGGGNGEESKTDHEIIKIKSAQTVNEIESTITSYTQGDETMIKNIAISINGTEEDYINSIKEKMKSIDPRIKDETIEFTDNTAFGFKVANKYTIRFDRINSNEQGNSGYKISIRGNDDHSLVTQTLSYASVSTNATANGIRQINIMAVTNDNFIMLKFFDYEKKKFILIKSIHDGDFNAVEGQGNDTIPLTRLDETDNGQTYTYANRLEYKLEGDEIEIIKSKVLLSNDLVKQKQLTTLYDCIDVVPDSIVTIDTDNFYALDKNTLVLIGD